MTTAEPTLRPMGPEELIFSGSTTSAEPRIGVSGGSQPLPIRYPYLGVNFVIALEGIFPARD